MLQRLGIILLILGLTMGESENLLIPLATIATGIGLVWISMGREAEDGND